MYSFLRGLVVCSLLSWATGIAAAPVELDGNAPYAGGRNGVQSDSGTPPPWEQSFNVPAGAMLDMIVWWGYRLNDEPVGAPHADAFEVAINGVIQSGTLSTVIEGPLEKYTLDIADELLAFTGVLSIVNNATDFEWYWQGVTGEEFDGNAQFPVFPVAFSLVGTLPAAVPEPSTLALFGLAGLVGVAGRRHRRA